MFFLTSLGLAYLAGQRTEPGSLVERSRVTVPDEGQPRAIPVPQEEDELPALPETQQPDEGRAPPEDARPEE
jgi:hypothetical protein